MATSRITTLFMLAALCLMHAHAAAGTIRLRTSALLGPDAPEITLAQVADLQGEDAQALAGAVVVTGKELANRGAAWVEVDIAMVRRAIEATGASMGRLAISGASCLVRREGVITDSEASATPKPPKREGEVVSTQGPPTIKARVAATITALLDVHLEDLRLLFDERDEPLLQQTEWGRRVIVKPASGASGSRMILEIRVYIGDRMLENARIGVDMQIRRRVVTLTQTVQRRSEVTATSLTESEQWLPAGGGTLVPNIESALGSIARTRLEAGSILRESEIEAAIAVRRNEPATVHCLRSGFEVRSRARAKSDGRVGEYIEFCLDGSKKTFTARVTGPGVAVVDLDGRHASAVGKDLSQ